MKTSKSILIIALITACFTSRATITIFTGPITDPANGHTYYLLSPDTWSNSEAFAQTLGGNLATVNSAAENQWISTTFFPYIPNSATDPRVNLWIGLYDPTHDTQGGTHASNFVWVDGDSASYRNWYSGEPDNYLGVEFYAEIRGPVNPLTYTWGDCGINDNAGFVYGVVEVVPEPSIYALIGTGVLGLWTYRKSRKME
jgi:Lectin C-type domain/PEP-CTERM motif